MTYWLVLTFSRANTTVKQTFDIANFGNVGFLSATFNRLMTKLGDKRGFKQD